MCFDNGIVGNILGVQNIFSENNSGICVSSPKSGAELDVGDRALVSVLYTSLIVDVSFFRQARDGAGWAVSIDIGSYGVQESRSTSKTANLDSV